MRAKISRSSGSRSASLCHFARTSAGTSMSRRSLSAEWPQEEAIEEGRFALWEVEIVDDFRGNELWQGRHREKCSLPKRIPPSSSTRGLLPPLMQLPVFRGRAPLIAGGTTTGTTGGLPAASNRRRMLKG